MNKVILMGRLVREPELRYSNTSNLAVVKFSLAVDRRFKREGQPDADFISCTAFGKTAEFINNYFTKGMRVAVTGRLQVSSWEEEPGKKRYSTDVVVEEAYFADSKKDSGNNEFAGRQMDQMSQADDGFAKVDDDDDELPF
ncbi:MAG TPA: single-stranded DNA-binding protein [Clostridia bacterium]|nr:single-stranded DNA-binding protein [Clostridia bacterium]HRX41652.1 single-stranded DNA-binding protein [Clostridia bacterium]